MNQSESDRQLYETLVRTHARDLYRFAFRLCGKAELAEDLVQETFFEAWRSVGSLGEIKRSKPWLFQILRHRHSHALRDNRHHNNQVARIDDVEIIPTAPAPGLLQRMANKELLQRALDALEFRYREPLLLVFLQGLTCQEAADSLDLPLGTVLSRIHRARGILRQYFSKHDDTTNNVPNTLPDHETEVRAT